MLELGHEPEPVGFQNSQTMRLCVVLGDEYDTDPTITEIAVSLERQTHQLRKDYDAQMGEGLSMDMKVAKRWGI